MYVRPQAKALEKRLAESRRLIQVVEGPRQVGKTTLVRQVLEGMRSPSRFASADEPELRGRDWIVEQWTIARLEAGSAGRSGAILALDEIQKIPGWSETVKRLWDEDSAAKAPIRVLLLGSSALLVKRGLSESLAGRFEVIPVTHW